MKKKYFGIILVVLALMSCLLVPNKIGADSGWDGSYDSGGSSGGSSWGGSSHGSSSWGGSSHSGSSSSGGSGSGSVDGTVVFIIFFIIVCVVIYANGKSKGLKNTYARPSGNQYTGNIVEYPVDKVKEVLPGFNEDTFRMQTYDIYKKIQEAWMNFDYETLQKYTTDSLYNLYKGQLEVLKVKNQQNIMKNFELIDFAIVDMSKTDDEIALKVRAKIVCQDYVIDTNTKKTVRGNDQRQVSYDYEMTFIRSIQEGTNKCPNCGAVLENNNSNTCPYCDSTIIADHYDWVLSKKEVKHQWIV